MARASSRVAGVAACVVATSFWEGNLWAAKETGHPNGQGSLAIEASPEAYPAARELSERLAEVQAGSQNLRSKLVGLQDTLAARFRDVAELSVEVQTRNEGGGHPPIGILELEAFLNDVPLVDYKNPPMTSRDVSLPVYMGPIPLGGYDLKVRSVVGIMLHDWPHAYLQGRWVVEKSFRISIEKSKPPQKYRVVLKPGDTDPQLQLVEGVQ